jgi:NAD(P)-dependent dehydrogenase (short-subunit alcohol dehydrogenase family)
VFDAVGPHVDVLVNNVGIFPTQSFEDITDEAWLNIFNLNVLTGVRCSRHFLKGMLERNWGRIIFIASESAFAIPAEMIHYGVTKTAQVSLARGIAELTRSTGVTCNTVLPGPTWTPGGARSPSTLLAHRARSGAVGAVHGAAQQSVRARDEEARVRGGQPRVLAEG